MVARFAPTGRTLLTSAALYAARWLSEEPDPGGTGERSSRSSQGAAVETPIGKNTAVSYEITLCEEEMALCQPGDILCFRQ